MAPFVNIPSIFLLDIVETEIIASTILVAKERLCSTQQTLPFRQQLFIILFTEIVVGTAHISELVCPCSLFCCYGE
jgi:hypothetical protein